MNSGEPVVYALDAPFTPPPPTPMAQPPAQQHRDGPRPVVTEGLDGQAIAEQLHIDPGSVTERIEDVLTTLGLADRAGLSSWTDRYRSPGTGQPVAPRPN
ncbi:hypothetical protein [Streptomyces sp. S.PB5]|uniref:hypothetical protein n=1 Tax=Streptomyces sp. S.PB5 TaxID=3020844 RepID=UPI0025B07E51|nr:hypothetical protein [Streptomyces sp. S.PB5]MDN3029523.1 hypothetical protein [Streptomyces sp. S.PB5]